MPRLNLATRLGLWALVFLSLAASAPTPRRKPAPDPEQIAIETTLIREAGIAAQFLAPLAFRGCLQMRAGDDRFGGVSGLAVEGKERVIAITDRAHWLRFRLLWGADGFLAGVADAEIAALRDERGVALQSRRLTDSEGLARLGDGSYAVSFEQRHLLRLYAGPDPLRAAGMVIAELDQTAAIEDNGGLEALATAPDGGLLAGQERGAAPSLWRLPAPMSPAPKTPPKLEQATALRRSFGYALTGLDELNDGGFVALYRFFAPGLGARAELRFWPPGDFWGERLALLNPPFPVDNFEAIAAIETAEETLILITSDDNFSASQRTLLCAFVWTRR